MLHSNASKACFSVATTAILLAFGLASAQAQQSVVSDWSTHHLVFSKPGNEMSALMSGKRRNYQRLVNRPRFRMQEMRRSPEWNHRFRNIESGFTEDRALFESKARVLGRRRHRSELKRDWAVSMAPAGSGTPVDMYPAVYAVSFTTASCSDYAVFPVNATGSATQANLVGFNNLYKTTCNTGTPTTQFAYWIEGNNLLGPAGGTVVTSPTTSLTGAKVAFVANAPAVLSGLLGNHAYLYVVTPGATSGNGTIAAPVALSTGGGTGYTVLELANGNTVTLSSPYVDYTDDIAYVGDDAGYLHKIIGVFNGTPTEVTTGGWPFKVITGTPTLTGPVFDSTSGNIFVGGSGGNLFCVNVGTNGASSPTACATASIPVAATTGSGAVLDAPTLDSTAGTVFEEAATTDGTQSILTQTTTSLGNAVRVNMGDGGADLYDGAFDNAYYNSSAGAYAGYIYFCGNASTAATPTLYRVGFNASGTMNGTKDTSSFQLVATGSTGVAVSCSPITENFDGTTDYIFVGVQGHGLPAGCSGNACVMNFAVGTASGSAASIPAAPTAVFSLGGNGSGMSGVVIDNMSTQTGASQIYFSNLQNGDATQVSQAGLQ